MSSKGGKMTAKPQGKTQLNMGFNFCSLKPVVITTTTVNTFRTSYDSPKKGKKDFPLPTNSPDINHKSFSKPIISNLRCYFHLKRSRAGVSLSSSEVSTAEVVRKRPTTELEEK